MCDLSNKMNHSNCAFERTAVILERRYPVPTKAEISRFRNARSVMDISFTKNASQISHILAQAFPSLYFAVWARISCVEKPIIQKFNSD